MVRHRRQRCHGRSWVFLNRFGSFFQALGKREAFSWQNAEKMGQNDMEKPKNDRRTTENDVTIDDGEKSSMFENKKGDFSAVSRPFWLIRGAF